jgi:hypothetical protein
LKESARRCSEWNLTRGGTWWRGHQAGFDVLDGVGGMAIIRDHTFELSQRAFAGLKAMRHYNGLAAAKLCVATDYTSATEQGPVVNFMLRRANASWFVTLARRRGGVLFLFKGGSFSFFEGFLFSFENVRMPQ